MSVLAVIPARGGSKGIPRKNLRNLCGKPLIGWTIEAALSSELIDRVVVSTDDTEIADYSLKCGADIPFLRPPSLATDEASSIDVVLHALDEVSDYENLLLLQPTSPLRGGGDIDSMVQQFLREQRSSCVSVCYAREHPYWMYAVSKSGALQQLIPDADVSKGRQQFPTCYVLNGAMYLSSIEKLRKERSFIHRETGIYLMTPECSIDIDDLFDWSLAEMLLTKQLSRTNST